MVTNLKEIILPKFSGAWRKYATGLGSWKERSPSNPLFLHKNIGKTLINLGYSVAWFDYLWCNQWFFWLLDVGGSSNGSLIPCSRDGWALDTYLRLYSRIGHPWTPQNWIVYCVFSPRFCGLPYFCGNPSWNLSGVIPYDLNISFIHLDLPVTFSILCRAQVGSITRVCPNNWWGPKPNVSHQGTRVPRVIDRTWHDFCAFRTSPLLGGSVLASAPSGFRRHSQHFTAHGAAPIRWNDSEHQCQPANALHSQTLRGKPVGPRPEDVAGEPCLGTWEPSLGTLGRVLQNCFARGPGLGNLAW